MAAFGARARAILSGLEAEVLDHPDLAARLLEARQELDSAGVPTAAPQSGDAELEPVIQSVIPDRAI